MTRFGVFWKGKLHHYEDGSPLVFDSRKEAETWVRLETQQMELADYTPAELRKMMKIKKVKG